jgi:hypothetical protein
MKVETFFEKFDQISNAPSAVEKMRELVLRMATSGRIAEQDPADPPASELLEEIFAVRDERIRRGKAKSRVEGNPITAGDTIDWCDAQPTGIRLFWRRHTVAGFRRHQQRRNRRVRGTNQ